MYDIFEKSCHNYFSGAPRKPHVNFEKRRFFKEIVTTEVDFRIGCTAMSTVIDYDDTNKHWARATVILYNKNISKLMK